LLTGVLKGRMGFDGFVVGDWNGHGQVDGCSNESCAAAINAGLDMFMAPDSWKGLYANTLAQARSGEIPASRIDDAVRRILRVKAKLGLFEAARPWEGRLEVLGSPAHRALARQAVRESLVLLKNNGSVLPIKGQARILVAGSGADDISRQTGGWTLSWQGTGNKNSDFPNAQSIFSGFREAARAQGGSAELSVDGGFRTRPDVAVVVFGETPYAEFQGDLKTVEYHASDKSDLALLKRLKAQRIPVVAVFLSGRPLWVNPEINAADAFVAAWLPGSEGGGVADVLVGDRAGKPRHDFTGKLAFSWPKTAAQAVLNVGHTPYDPLFAYGYGLTYGQPVSVPELSERSGISAAGANTDIYFAAGRTPPPWSLAIRPAGAVTAQAVDAGVQEGGRQLTWSGNGVAAITGPSIDLVRQAVGDLALLVEYRLDARPTGPVRLSVGAGALDLGPALAGAPSEAWRSIRVRLSCFREAGADLSKVTEPFAVAGSAGLKLSIRAVRLTADPADAACLPRAANSGQ
ncbi:MAG: glycoside hydrolase family 3 C-terminal domain-containing protein, partial [Phenylobacterium sp.]